MQIILLEKIRKLGDFGQTVQVASGYARNYLIPKGLAVMASPSNALHFEQRRKELEAAAQQRLSAAQQRATALEAVTITIAAQASDEGRLYGSIGASDIAKALKEQKGFVCDRHEIRLATGPLREVGSFTFEVHLHAEVNVPVALEIVAAA